MSSFACKIISFAEGEIREIITETANTTTSNVLDKGITAQNEQTLEVKELVTQELLLQNQDLESSSMKIAVFFNDTAPTEIYTLSLHDALPISIRAEDAFDFGDRLAEISAPTLVVGGGRDRKSTRMNSSHANILYVVLCL